MRVAIEKGEDGLYTVSTNEGDPIAFWCQRDNAELIVTSVNNHAALVECLEEIVAAQRERDHAVFTKDNIAWDSNERLLNELIEVKAKALVKQAKGT